MNRSKRSVTEEVHKRIHMALEYVLADVTVDGSSKPPCWALTVYGEKPDEGVGLYSNSDLRRTEEALLAARSQLLNGHANGHARRSKKK